MRLVALAFSVIGAKRGNPGGCEIASALVCLAMTEGDVSLRAKRGNLGESQNAKMKKVFAF